ncbi:unnamed protein product [Rotaria magnacalcarata]|uniref:Uncharacterized protein n=1 Tax=Rotaria magnacalcarata TaxID=392030 RepID=A0A815J1Z9_9BILA|nr:unnamed protein product [Rotaria magnacalcarata]CAF1376512.1 unnamed protein product [Rotaria magnacalcarata]CAF2062549.1 unnamed protein product [Rotaria magnacalcarata]CAF2231300.1 unnamed protein product [Rotaria magnacalcarata]CAF3970785.1 unnamed protein product [Rotaria magnacalcarata]
MGNLISRGKFKDGRWQHQYWQNKQQFGIYTHVMTFDKKTKTLYGRGTDNVGDFTLSGRFDPSQGYIHMVQKYIINSGNSKLNMGHVCIYELHWMNTSKSFDGEIFGIANGRKQPSGYFQMWHE